MTPERWKQIEAVFEQALELPEAARADFFNRTCNGDEGLRREVESLLQSHAHAGDIIEQRSRFFSQEMLDELGAAVATGQSIGPYRVIRELGRGGMGAVYLAERADEQYRKQVAIKLIKRGMDTDSVLRHFRNERQILAGFDHPNIARLLDGGTTETGLPYFAMEYVEGQPVNEYCDRHNFSVTERLKLFREVCAAVSYAHRHLVIHRDIKRSNILINAEGVPKLLDFGIAKILQEGDDTQSLGTITGMRLMTPEYASPEQLRGQPVTTVSDVYSLGVVLYELLTGQLPYRFTSQSPNDVARAITDSEPLRPSTAVKDRDSKIENRHSADSRMILHDSRSLRGDLDNIVLMALRKEPARRYQSVEQFSEDIRRHLGTRPVLARRDTMGYRGAKFVRRNTAATVAALLILVSLIAGLITTTWQARRANVEKNRAERRFNDVRQFARSVLFDYHDAIKDLPGATRVRERLVKDALTYLDSLAREARGDPALQRELAAAYDRVGDVRGAAYGASLGDRVGATESYEKALHIREALVAAAPRDVQNQRELAESYKRVGSQLLDTSEATAGLEKVRKSLDLILQLGAEQPADKTIQRDLADGYNALGSALEDRGDIAAALENYRKAGPIYEQLLERDPADRASRRSFSVTVENIGRALFLTDDVAGALEYNRKALALREALLEEDRTNADYRRILGISYQNNGDYRAWLKDHRGALESFRKKLTVDEDSVAADPENAQARRDLAYSGQRIGDLLVETGEHAQAPSYYRRALEMYEKNMVADPQDPMNPIRIAQVRAHLGGALAKLGSVGPARKECDNAADLLRTTADNDAAVNQRRVRVVAYADLGDVYAALADISGTPTPIHVNDMRAARDMYQHSLTLMQDLRKRGILDDDEAKEIDAVSRKISDCEKLLGN